MSPYDAPADSDEFTSAAADVASEFAGDPVLGEPVDPEWAAAADAGYGTLTPTDPVSAEELSVVGSGGYGGSASTDGGGAAASGAGAEFDDAPALTTPAPGAEASSAGGLSDEERNALALLSNSRQSSLPAPSLGAYDDDEDDDEDDDDEDDAPAVSPAVGGAGHDAEKMLAQTQSEGGRGGRFRPRGRKQIAGAVVAVVVAVVLVAALAARFLGGSDEGTKQAAPQLTFTQPTPSQPPAKPTPGALPPGTVVVPVKSAEAPACMAGSSTGMNAFDGNPDTAWRCVVGSSKIGGQVLQVTFDAQYVIDAVFIIPGWAKRGADDEWIKHYVASSVYYQFNDRAETGAEQPTKGMRSGVQTKFPEPGKAPVVATRMIVKITGLMQPTGTYDVGSTAAAEAPTGIGMPGGDGPKPADPTKLTDFAISTITVLGHKPT